jgi:hypothetical protein
MRTTFMEVILRRQARLAQVALTALLTVTSVGCGVGFKAETPAGFVALKDQAPGYEYRATTPDGLVLAVRVIDNDPPGDDAFWTGAIELRLRALGGYALLDRHPVTCKTGQSGTQLRFGHDEGTNPHLYVVTLFVTPKRLFVLEAGGAKALMERDKAKVDAFVASFTPQ